MDNHTDTIAAVATGSGGAIAVIRVSGPGAIAACDAIFSRDIFRAKGFSILYGNIADGPRHIDDVLLSLFRAPRSYTGEDMAEISCHGSPYVKSEIMRLLSAHGVRPAGAGEFTMRAFLNGKIDLSQAEAVADIIASEGERAHALAVGQMRGGYSCEFSALREKLVELASLLELELDFSEEDVEFAERGVILDTIRAIKERITMLKDSFARGNVIKNGLPVAIAGAPNVGKSTLLNALLNDDRAMVSEIAGTTRDAIEDVIDIGGVKFRLIDTAGIRDTDDTLESMGIERTMKHVKDASVILLVADARDDAAEIIRQARELEPTPGQALAILLNKTDRGLPSGTVEHIERATHREVIAISAKEGTNIERLKAWLYAAATADSSPGDIVVSNARHHEALALALESITSTESALSRGLSGDLLAEDIRAVIHHLGLITGQITTTDILSSIFGKFCIGK